VSAKAGTKAGTLHDALAPYPWSGSVNWCLAEASRNGDQRRPIWALRLARTSRFFYIILCLLFANERDQ